MFVRGNEVSALPMGTHTFTVRSDRRCHFLSRVQYSKLAALFIRTCNSFRASAVHQSKPLVREKNIPQETGYSSLILIAAPGLQSHFLHPTTSTEPKDLEEDTHFQENLSNTSPDSRSSIYRWQWVKYKWFSKTECLFAVMTYCNNPFTCIYNPRVAQYRHLQPLNVLIVLLLQSEQAPCSKQQLWNSCIVNPWQEMVQDNARVLEPFTKYGTISSTNAAVVFALLLPQNRFYSSER